MKVHSSIVCLDGEVAKVAGGWPGLNSKKRLWVALDKSEGHPERSQPVKDAPPARRFRVRV